VADIGVATRARGRYANRDVVVAVAWVQTDEKGMDRLEDLLH